MTLNNTAALLLLSSIARDSLPQSSVSNDSTPYPQLVNNTFVIEVVRSVHEVYKFKNFIFYITERLDLESEKAVEFFDYFWATFPSVPSIIISSRNQDKPTRASDYYMDGFLSTPALCLVFTTEPSDPIMQVAAESMKAVRFLKTIFIVFPVLESEEFFDNFTNFNRFWDIIRSTYEWIWQQQFLNTIVLTIRDNVYLMDPYPALNIINKTDIWQVDDFFVDMSKDFKGYLVDTIIRYDLPRVFEKRRIKVGSSESVVVSGTSGKLFTAFIETINATLNDSTEAISETEPVELNKMLELVAGKTQEVSMHSFTAMFSSIEVGQSYPIGINDWCIMVPYRNRSPEHLYLQRVFQYSTWMLVCFAVVYISVVLWLCTPSRPRDYSFALMQALCSILSIVPTSIFRTENLRMRFLFFALFVLGFVTSNWYISKITSYLTTSLQSSQINSVHDVIAANLRIKVFDYEYERLETMPKQYPKRFLQQLDIVDKHFMDHHRDPMNTSYGYSIQTDRWQFLDIQQRFLRKPLFRLSQICMGPFYHVFPLYTDSHLQMPFKYFIMYASQSGFLKYWHMSSFADALRLKYVRMLRVYEEPMPLSLRFFRPIWMVWWFGLTMSGVIFVIEVKWTTIAHICGGQN